MLGTAAVWPLSAYTFHPVVFPALVVVALCGVILLVRPEVGIALAVALAPLSNVGAGPVSVKLLVWVLTFGLLGYGLLLARQTRQGAPRSLTLGVSAFLAVGILSAFVGIDPGGSVGRVLSLVAAVALYLGVLNLCRERHELLVVVAGVLAGLAIAGAHGLSQYLLGFDQQFSIVSGGQVVARVQGAFGHPNEFGGFVAALIPLALVVAATRAFSFRLRLLAATATALAVPALFFTYARGPVLAVVAGLLVWVSVLRPKLALPVAILVVVGALIAAPAALRERFETTGSSDVTLRSDIWRGALTIYSDHPLLGVGPNNFGRAYSALPTSLPGGGQRRLLHTTQVLVPPYAENLYLHVLAEEGILGFAAYLVLVAAALLTVYRGSRSREPAGRALAFGIGAALLTISFHGIVQVTLFTELMLPVFALLGVAGRIVTLDWEAGRVAEAPAQEA